MLVSADYVMSRVVISGINACWPARLSPQSNGYVYLHPKRGVKVLAHRAAYEATRGPIPEGMEIDHLCRNRACCNPAHLEPVTHQENHKRRVGYKTGPYDVGAHCRHGHERTPENTGVNNQGSRFCRPCAREVNKRSRGRRTSNA